MSTGGRSESDARPRFALLLVAVASRLVGRSARARWRREWEAELYGRFEELRARGAYGPRAHIDLTLRAAGSFVDALSYQRERWSMDGFGQDVRYATRALLRRPGYSVVVLLTLAIGIGANTAIFSVARDVLLRPFPYPDPDRVVSVASQDMLDLRPSGNVTYPNLHDIAESTTSFEGIALQRGWGTALEGEAGSVVVQGATVTANYFSVLGARAGLGRFFRPDEQGEGREPLVVLSHSTWVEHFGADPSVVGRDVRFNGTPYTVIGVTAADFEDPWLWGGPGTEPVVWRTVWSPPSEWPRSGRSWKGLARVRADVSLEAAQEEIAGAFARLAEAYPEANANRTLRIVPLRERVAGPARPVLLVLVGSVGLLLLIACANLANLMLARELDRRSDLQVHVALGASRGRIVHRELVEAGLLTATGGALGLVLALGLGRLASRLDGAFLPRPVSGEADAGVLLFSALVTLGAGLLCGLLPAVHAAAAGARVPGRDEGRGATRGRAGHRARRTLVVGELALTVALLVGAGLLGRSFLRLGQVDLGLRTEGVVSMDLHGSAWWELDAGDAQAQWDAVLAAARAVPGVEAAGAIDYTPLGGDYSCDGIQRPELPPAAPGEGQCAEVRVVLPGGLEALGIPLQRGRMIDGRDVVDAPPVAVVDRTLANLMWPGEDPVGRFLDVHTRVHEIVGVVGDQRHFGPGSELRPMIYLPAPQEGWNGIARGLALIVSGPGGPAVVPSVRAALASVNPAIAVGRVATMESLVRRSTAAPRFRTGLMVAFALAALALAVLGIAGVMSYSVSSRRRELGVRLALGARPSEVRGLVMAEGARMTVVGLALGLAGALALAGVLDAMLFQVDPRDPLVFAAVAAALALAALGACWAPARRASNVDPVTALTVD